MWNQDMRGGGHSFSNFFRMTEGFFLKRCGKEPSWATWVAWITLEIELTLNAYYAGQRAQWPLFLPVFFVRTNLPEMLNHQSEYEIFKGNHLLTISLVLLCFLLQIITNPSFSCWRFVKASLLLLKKKISSSLSPPPPNEHSENKTLLW